MTNEAKKLNPLAFLPFVIFIGFGLMFAWGMWGKRIDKDKSPLIGKPIPEMIIPTLDDKEINLASLSGKPLIINFFASWCAPCKAEHKQLLQMKSSEYVLIGIAYEDDPKDSKTYIEAMSNPYTFIGVDRKGALGSQLGLSGVPETYVVNANGVITYKHKGAIMPDDIKRLVEYTHK